MIILKRKKKMFRVMGGRKKNPLYQLKEMGRSKLQTMGIDKILYLEVLARSHCGVKRWI